MKLNLVIFAASLPAFAASVACPFAELHRAGLLSPDEASKFEAVRRDPKAAEVLFEHHKREVAPTPQAGGLIGPTLDGILDLPLGGGLCKASHVCSVGDLS